MKVSTRERGIMDLGLDRIRIDGGTQPRTAIDEDVVADYADLCGSGVDLPPVTVFFDGTAYWLADGFHRYWANKRINREHVVAEVHQGTQRDAILYSVGANTAHGLRRTNADKRKAVVTMLTDRKVSHDEDGKPWTDNAIAKQCSVDPKTVAKVRSTLEIQSAPVRRTSDGRTMDTSNIGRRRSPTKPSPGRQIMTKEEYEAEAAAEAGHSTPAPRFQAPSKAIPKAYEAIAILRSILPSDPRRIEAMHMVRDWIIDNFG